MINEFIQILKTWPTFFQFLYITLTFYFTFCLISDLISRGFHFLSNSLPVILHGWPTDIEVEMGEEEPDESTDDAEKK